MPLSNPKNRTRYRTRKEPQAGPMPSSGNMSDVSTSASESDSGSISNFRRRTRSGARPPPPKRRRVEHALPIALRPLKPRTPILHQLGRMNVECPHCDALHWSAERSSASKADSPSFYTCCSNGKVSLPIFAPLLLSSTRYLTIRLHLCHSDLIFAVADPVTSGGIDFRKNLRAYICINALAFPSLGAKTEAINRSAGVPTFVISGGLYHLIGSLKPAPPTDARKFAQIQSSDPGQEITRRIEASGSRSLNMLILTHLQIMLKEKEFILERSLAVFKRQRENSAKQLTVRLLNPTGTGNDAKRYNLPSADEVDAIIYAKKSSFEK